MPGLGTSLGRGGATTAPQDLVNSDCILIAGSSMAEAHPVAFRYVVQAKERGATVIHVDPRYSRTSALADIWAPIRAGGDIAFFGGLVRHVIESEGYFREYVVHYTNAACLLREDFRDTDELNGLFSGWDAQTESYDPATWQYAGDDPARPQRDPTLQHPRCVFQVLRRHFARYTPEMVQRVAGIPPDVFHRIADALTAASGPDKTAAVCYAVGWTQQSKGVQIIRAAAVLQLLLGNIGRPGGGIMALRGHASIQGSTDIPTLYNLLPGYLPMPRVESSPRGEGEAPAEPQEPVRAGGQQRLGGSLALPSDVEATPSVASQPPAETGDATLADYLRRHTPSTGWWTNLPAYIVSLLRAYYGARATADNDWGFDWLPKCSRNHSHFAFVNEMYDGRVEGLFVMGQNPAVGGQNARFHRKALARLKWLVVRDFVEMETAAFWHNSPEIERGELRTEDIATEVFLFPAAGHAEKSGTFTNTQRLLQWHQKAVEPPGDARSEAWFMHQLAKRLKAKAAASTDPRDEPLRALDWWYPEAPHGEPDTEAVLAEINGWRTECGMRSAECGMEDGSAIPHSAFRTPHSTQLSGFAELRADGSTACGCWIYSGVLGPDGVNKARQRAARDRLGHGWGFAWPADRRILYNRASARPDGRPWSEAKKLVWWDEAAGRWTGDDIPDFPIGKRPDYQPPPGAAGIEAHPGDAPFLMQRDGLGWLFVPDGLVDGPLPTHYEPLESPVLNALYEQQSNPMAQRFARPENPLAPAGDPQFPCVLTTYRLTEHQTGGAMTRFLSHLAELQPALFAELSPELAAEIDATNGDWITIATPRGQIEARALVTRRLRPLQIGDRPLHQVALPWHWGRTGLIPGDAANDLTAITGEPNVSIHEGKALVCTVRKGRFSEKP